VNHFFDDKKPNAILSDGSDEFLEDLSNILLPISCVRDRSEKPTARHERGLAAHSPTHVVTPKAF
jgi:hypothetical protein